MAELSDGERQRIHDTVAGWPGADFLRKQTRDWPAEWFDEAIAALPRLAHRDAIPEAMAVLRQIRGIRCGDVFPEGDERNRFASAIKDHATRDMVVRILSGLTLLSLAPLPTMLG